MGFTQNTGSAEERERLPTHRLRLLKKKEYYESDEQKQKISI